MDYKEALAVALAQECLRAKFENGDFQASDVDSRLVIIEDEMIRLYKDAYSRFTDK